MVSRVVTPRATRAGTSCAGISYLSVSLSVCLSGYSLPYINNLSASLWPIYLDLYSLSVCLADCLSVFLPVWLIYLFVYVCLVFLSVKQIVSRLSVLLYLLVFLSACLSVYQYVWLVPICLSAGDPHSSACLFVCLSVTRQYLCLPACLSVTRQYLCLPACLTVYLGIEPEVDPWDNDQHAARDVDGDEVVGELSLEHQVHRQAAVLPCINILIVESLVYMTGWRTMNMIDLMTWVVINLSWWLLLFLCSNWSKKLNR